MILPSNLQKIENILGRKFIIKNEYERKVDFNLWKVNYGFKAKKLDVYN